jgi:DNA replication protein DnaC
MTNAIESPTVPTLPPASSPNPTTTSPSASSRARAALEAAEAEARILEAQADAAANAAAAVRVDAHGRGGPARPLLAGINLPLPTRPAQTPEQIDAVRAHEERRRKALRMDRLVREAQIPEKYQAADLDDFEIVPPEHRTAYADKVRQLRQLTTRPIVVTLCGTRGPGKTHMACALIREFCRRGHTARYTKAMSIFKAIKREYGKKGGDELAVERNFTAPALLVIDEVQVRAETKWEDDLLCDMVDTRYGANRVTVLIANLTPQELEKSAGTSIANRMREGGRHLVCDWTSLRPLIEPPELFADEVPLAPEVRGHE